MNVILVPMVISLALGGQPKEPAKGRLDESAVKAELEKALKEHDVPALGAAVVTSKGVEAIAVAGVRKRGNAVKVTKEDRFHLGSDTKSMTAFLVAILVQRKLLAYDLTLDKAFPDLASKMHADYKKVTLEQLLTHRAGLPANLEIPCWMRPVRDPIRRQRQETAAHALTVKPFVEPGTKFVYSNVGYVLAGAIAERVTNSRWEELMQKRLFGPLKMTSAGFGPMASPGKVNQPWSHEENGKPVDPGRADADNQPVLGPAGRVHSSLADWARYVADQLQGAQGKNGLLPASAYRKLHEPAKVDEHYTPGGWLYVKGPGGVLLTHDGSNDMNYATAALLLKYDLAVLVVCNQNTRKGKKATTEVREKLLGMALDRREKTDE